MFCGVRQTVTACRLARPGRVRRVVRPSVTVPTVAGKDAVEIVPKAAETGRVPPSGRVGRPSAPVSETDVGTETRRRAARRDASRPEVGDIAEVRRPGVGPIPQAARGGGLGAVRPPGTGPAGLEGLVAAVARRPPQDTGVVKRPDVALGDTLAVLDEMPVDSIRRA